MPYILVAIPKEQGNQKIRWGDGEIGGRGDRPVF
jgi:hypothetical protein